MLKKYRFLMGCKVTHFYQSTTPINLCVNLKYDYCFEKYFSFIFTKN